jgi:hypothetical protein
MFSIFFLCRHTPAVQARCPITIEEMIALMNIAIEYVATQKRTLDFARFKPNAKSLLDKYVKYQRVSSQRITHFLPRMGGEHPDFIVKGQLKEPYYPKHPIALEDDFEIPVDFPPNTTDIYVDWNANFTTPVKTLDDTKRLLALLALDIRYLAGAGKQWGKVGTEACGQAAPEEEEGAASAALISISRANPDRSPSPVEINPYKFTQGDIKYYKRR